MTIIFYISFTASIISFYLFWIYGVRRDLLKKGFSVSEIGDIFVTGKPMMEDICKLMEVSRKKDGVPASAVGFLISAGGLVISFLGLVVASLLS